MKNATIRFTDKSRKWKLLKSAEFEQKLLCEQPQAAGWYKITVTAENKAAKTFFDTLGQFYVNQNHNTQAIALQANDYKQSLIFLRHNELKMLTLHWHQQVLGAEPAEFSVKIKSILPSLAWLGMLRHVSRQQAAQGKSKTEIYRLTRARIKRSGANHALKKLVQEYQPLLSHQLISCEPYSYWRRTQEQHLKQSIDCLSSNREIHFHVLLRTKTDDSALCRSVRSMQVQQHPYWTLSILQHTGNASAALTQLLQSDQRLQQVQTPEIAAEHYLILLQEGDELASNALPELAKALNESNAQIVYSDHDLLNEDLIRVAPRFKPKWSPDFLMHQNYFGLAFCLHASLLQKCVNETNWWQQHHYVLLLKAVLNILPANREKEIKHVPQVLFHQAMKNQKQGYSDITVKRLYELYHQLSAQNGEQLLKITRSKTADIFHLHYAIPQPWPLVSLVIPTRDALDITRTCVNSILLLTQYPHYEIIIVDNQSTEPETLTWFNQINQQEKVKVIQYNKPFNYSAINNFAVQHAKGSIIGLINNDTEIINKSWLTEMLQHACRPEIGCVGAKLYYFDNTIQHAGVILGLWGVAGHAHKNLQRYEKGHQSRLASVHNLSAVTAACLLVKKAIYEKVGGLDEHQLTIAFNDVDFCLKVQQAGYRNLWTPNAELYHYESKSRGKEDTPQKKAREQGEISYMKKKWAALIAADPYYNPNLTRLREDFSINIDE